MTMVISRGLQAGKGHEQLVELRKSLLRQDRFPCRIFVSSPRGRDRETREWVSRIECWGFVAETNPDWTTTPSGQRIGFYVVVTGVGQRR